MSRWLTLVLGALAIFGVVFGLRAMMGGQGGIETVRGETIPTLDKPVPAVRDVRDGMQVMVKRSVAEVRPLFGSSTGRTESERAVTVRAEASGTVRAANVNEGALVNAGDVLCEMDIEGRGARVREAEAAFRAKEIDHKAAAELVEKGWAAQPRLDAAKAELDGARAALNVARSDLDKTRVAAPFRGVFETRMADVGDFLAPGSPCGVVIQLDPIVVIAEAADLSAERIRLNAEARARMPDGGEAIGTVKFVAKTADPTRRTFRVEVALDNADGAIPVGRATEVRIRVGQGDAHRVSPSLLTVDEQGRIGLRYLDAGGVVSFIAADVVDESPDEIWVSGLPHETLIVAEGQESVKPGVRGTPVVVD